ncbi:MAG: class I mannose-6-phosphate isomerase [Bacteroidales bacterium]|nr:class I mannose-6-phosphate isomerase [Bacteroidales bacterium]
MEEKALYPFRFLPKDITLPWGTQSYKIADLGVIDTMVDNGWFGGNSLADLMQTYLERVVGEPSFNYYGTQFPVMVKTLSVNGKTSLHVNADDETAAQRYDTFGKTAIWYITETSDDAVIYLGLRHDISAADFYTSCLDGTIERHLNAIHPVKGECFLIQPGTVHAASGHVGIIEISESSELFFRLCDWGREHNNATAREMHLEEAIDLIDFKAYKAPASPEAGETFSRRLAVTDQFTISELPLPKALEIGTEGYESFILYTCVSGSAMVQVRTEEGKDNWPVRPGEVILIPDEIENFTLIPAESGTVLLETVITPRPAEDQPEETTENA